MSIYENIEYILVKRQDNIKNKKNWFDGLTDEECKTYNRYYIKKLRENPEKKDAEKKYSSEKIICDCGCIVSRANYYKHKKTTKHSDMQEAKKSLNEEQLTQLKEILEAQKKAKQDRIQNNLEQQFIKLDTKQSEEKDKLKI